MNCDGPVGVPVGVLRNRRGNSSSGTASADAKVTPNQGMIWTKRIVFSVDRLALFEFSPIQDRKSTRLNSSHSQISYAVFCLKKKKKEHACSNPSLLNSELTQ